MPPVPFLLHLSPSDRKRVVDNPFNLRYIKSPQTENAFTICGTNGIWNGNWGFNKCTNSNPISPQRIICKIYDVCTNVRNKRWVSNNGTFKLIRTRFLTAANENRIQKFNSIMPFHEVANGERGFGQPSDGKGLFEQFPSGWKKETSNDVFLF